MQEQTAITRIAAPLNLEKMPRFIDPYSDWGFKHLFGKVPNRDFLIKFLNGVFNGRKVIVDIQYNNSEHKGPGKRYRKTVFDLYCTGDKGEKFIVEMQNEKDKNFKDRSIFYTANLIQEQGASVASDWDYELPEIYFLAIMNFEFDNSHPNHYIHDVRLIEINTHQEFYTKLNYIFIEMPKFKKAEGDLVNEQDEWFYILNNMKHLDGIPVSLKGKPEYEKLFEMAEIGNLTPVEMNEYQQNLKIQRDNYSVMKTAKEEALEQGIEIGREEGLEIGEAKGEYKKAVEMAVKLKAKNMLVEEIAEITGLLVEEIETL